MKMLCCIRVSPEMTFLQNILRRDSPDQPLKCIELLTVTYSTNSAPYFCTRILQKLATVNKDKYPLASYVILNQTYMDDILATSNSFE